MCKFCDEINGQEYRVDVRSIYADDNVCNVISGDGYSSKCEGCGGCKDENCMFTLTAHKYGIQLGYIHKIRNVNIMPFSECIHINFCPWCGKQISEEITEFEKAAFIELSKNKY